MGFGKVDSSVDRFPTAGQKCHVGHVGEEVFEGCLTYVTTGTETLAFLAEKMQTTPDGLVNTNNARGVSYYEPLPAGTMVRFVDPQIRCDFWKESIRTSKLPDPESAFRVWRDTNCDAAAKMKENFTPVSPDRELSLTPGRVFLLSWATTPDPAIVHGSPEWCAKLLEGLDAGIHLSHGGMIYDHICR